jgi:hypothetical protein
MLLDDEEIVDETGDADGAANTPARKRKAVDDSGDNLPPKKPRSDVLEIGEEDVVVL